MPPIKWRMIHCKEICAKYTPCCSRCASIRSLCRKNIKVALETDYKESSGCAELYQKIFDVPNRKSNSRYPSTKPQILETPSRRRILWLSSLLDYPLRISAMIRLWFFDRFSKRHTLLPESQKLLLYIQHRFRLSYFRTARLYRFVWKWSIP